MPSRRTANKTSVVNKSKNSQEKSDTTNDDVTLTRRQKPKFQTLSLYHARVPYIPAMHGLLFEGFLFIYLIVALFCQYLYIYKTVWWYPLNLPPSNMSMNFDLIDINLTSLLVILFTYRFIKAALLEHFRPDYNNLLLVLAWLFLVLVIVAVWVMELVRNLFAILEDVSHFKFLFLCYPILLWLPFYGLAEEGWITYAWNFIFSKENSKNHKVVDPNHWQKLQAHFKSICQLSPSAIVTPDPEKVRDDVKQLCLDFNTRLTEVIFTSTLCAYYAGLVPMFFTKPYHYFNFPWSLQHSILIMVNCFTMVSSHLFTTSYLEVLHKCASLLGKWVPLPHPDYRISAEQCASLQPPVWHQSVIYPKGAIISHNGKPFIAAGEHNTAIPNNLTHSRFYRIFQNPLGLLNVFVTIHLLVVVYQIYVILFSSHWEQLIAPTLLQFFSFYFLYHVLRDRIVLGKAYSFHDRVLKKYKNISENVSKTN